MKFFWVSFWNAHFELKWENHALTKCSVALYASDIQYAILISYRDEEYDRGKRKKVRESKHIFGGQNPFQEIATKKMKLKQAKVDRYSSGNRPFRIWYEENRTMFIILTCCYILGAIVMLSWKPETVRDGSIIFRIPYWFVLIVGEEEGLGRILYTLIL